MANLKKGFGKVAREMGEIVGDVKNKNKRKKTAPSNEASANKKNKTKKPATETPGPAKANTTPVKRKAKSSNCGNSKSADDSTGKMREKSNSFSGSSNLKQPSKRKINSVQSSQIPKKIAHLKTPVYSPYQKRHENCFISPNMIMIASDKIRNKIRSNSSIQSTSTISGGSMFQTPMSSRSSVHAKTPTHQARLASLPKSPQNSSRSSSAKSNNAMRSVKPVNTPKHELLCTLSSNVSLHPPTEEITNPIVLKPIMIHTDPNPPSIVENKNKPALQTAVMPLATVTSTKAQLKKQSSYTNDELLKFYREQVDRAIKDKKTFTVCGNYLSVRKALVARGWVEKIHINYNLPDKDNIRKLIGYTLAELVENVHDKTSGNLYKRVILSKLLGRHQVDLFWDYGVDAYKLNPDNVKLTIINNIRRGVYSYSTKQGLCELMKRSHWYNAPGISYVRHPRSYSLAENGDPEEFTRDFKITAAMSMLKWIVFSNENCVCRLVSDSGKVPLKTFHFALSECEKFIQRIKHEDIDTSIDDALEFEWNQFLEYYYKCVHIGNHFQMSSLETEQSLVHKSKIMLIKLRKVWPFLDMDGYMNIWILKPTAGSRGIGIHICRTLQYVLKVVTERKTMKYVIQKYIERPLLIYNTKFDIRQWFLISCTSPLTIWVYKSCYLRFSTQTYNLRKLHESIHLTNNSVQCKYSNNNRDPGLPEYNMWDSIRFKTYLDMIGYPNVYKEVIFPGMKECITAAVLIHQDYINTRKNCFELYGADFMLTEDFKPWLIEINSRPALHASTPITARMCPAVLEDTIKVDKARNSKAQTGMFELLYQEKQHPLPPLDPAGLTVRGIPLPAEYFYTPPNDVIQDEFQQPEKLSSDIININSTQNYMRYVSKQMKKTLENLLDIIHKERERRQTLKSKQRGNYLTMKKSSSCNNKMHNNMDKESIEYIDNINKVNENIKEIQQIFKPTLLSDKKLNDIVTSFKYHESENEGLNKIIEHPELQEIFSTTKDLTKQHNSEELVRLQVQTDAQLKVETKKIEQALMKITPVQNRGPGSVFGDFLSFMKVWRQRSNESSTLS